MMVIKRKRNYAAGNDMQQAFKHAWDKAVEQGYAGYARQVNPFNLRQPSMLLDRSISRTGLDKKTFAEKSGKNQHHFIITLEEQEIYQETLPSNMQSFLI